MAGPAFRASGARATSAGAASIAAAKPTVDGQNGLLLAVVTSKNNGVHASSTAGWTKLAQVNSGVSFTASLWVAAESAGAPTFTWSGSVACSAQIAYYSDPANTMFVGSSVIGVAGTGTTSPHTSVAIVTDAANVLALYVDVAAANTALTNPTGWTQDVSGGSATDAGRTTFGSKGIAASAASSGAISSAGAAAAWVQWQLEIKGSAAGAAVQSSKLEAAAWVEPPDGADASKIEVGAWLEAQSTTLDASKFEAGAWVEPPDGADACKIEVGAWLEAASLRSRRMSLM